MSENKVVLYGGIGEKNSNNNTQWKEQNRIYDSKGIATSVTTCCHPYYYLGGIMPELAIRKLTPLECLKLQAFTEEDYNNIKDLFGDGAIYHVAGDSITTTVICALFGTMANVDYRKEIEEYTEKLKGDYNE